MESRRGAAEERLLEKPSTFYFFSSGILGAGPSLTSPGLGACMILAGAGAGGDSVRLHPQSNETPATIARRSGRRNQFEIKNRVFMEW